MDTILLSYTQIPFLGTHKCAIDVLLSDGPGQQGGAGPGASRPWEVHLQCSGGACWKGRLCPGFGSSLPLPLPLWAVAELDNPAHSGAFLCVDRALVSWLWFPAPLTSSSPQRKVT